jgi:peptidoglycan/LPS O-acetylase OafA/YrhL
LRLGGVTGVTIFFTLSGFLITRLLLAEHESQGRIALGAFYARRALRLVPAFAVMVAVMGVVVWSLGMPVREYILQSALALGYVSNIARINEVNMGPLGHTWSLAVEEQFYLVWPLLLVFLLRGRLRSWIVPLLALSVVGSLALRYANLSDYFRSHDALDVNVFALGLGALVAVFAHTRERLPAIPSWVPVAVIVACLVPQASSDEEFFPLSVAISPLTALATAALLVSVHNSDGPAWLRSRPMQWFGVRSYAIYLWHAPLLMFGHGWGEKAVVLAVSVVLAMLSRTYVEQPALKLKRRFEKVRTTFSAPNVRGD